MPRVIVTAGAAVGMERCRLFLQRKNPLTSRRAGQAIDAKLTQLETMPEMGRPLSDTPELRDLTLVEFEGLLSSNQL